MMRVLLMIAVAWRIVGVLAMMVIRRRRVSTTTRILVMIRILVLVGFCSVLVLSLPLILLWQLWPGSAPRWPLVIIPQWTQMWKRFSRAYGSYRTRHRMLGMVRMTIGIRTRRQTPALGFSFGRAFAFGDFSMLVLFLLVLLATILGILSHDFLVFVRP